MNKYPNSGTLGVNTRKSKDSHPGYTGQCEIDGKPYWISAWVKEGRDGKFFSLSFKAKEQRQAAPQKAREQEPVYDDDIPF